MSYHITNNHEEIRTWIEGNNGKPAVARGATDPITSLSIAWHGRDIPINRELEEISWEEFFDAFETGNFSFKFDRAAKGGTEEFSYNFINRDSVPALDNKEFILPEDNEMARENMFPSAPSTEEGDTHPEG
jgi:hypothetical protein